MRKRTDVTIGPGAQIAHAGPLGFSDPARLGAGEQVPEEFVMVGGTHFSLGSREVINYPNELEFAVADEPGPARTKSSCSCSGELCFKFIKASKRTVDCFRDRAGFEFIGIDVHGDLQRGKGVAFAGGTLARSDLIRQELLNNLKKDVDGDGTGTGGSNEASRRRSSCRTGARERSRDLRCP